MIDATGVLLMTYGAPRSAADLPAYLARVRGGKEPSAELVAEMTRRYELIGGSPLVRITRDQAAALEAALGRPWRVAAGMRYSEPTIAQAVQALAADGAKRIRGIVMSPQRSQMLMAGYDQALTEAARACGVAASVAGSWHREPAFLEAMAGSVREALARLEGPAILMTAHSLPRRVFEAEPEYVAQLRETAELIAERAGLASDGWQWAYQSAGHTAEQWLRPDLKELFPALAAAGARDVLVVPVQFLADHLEVLYDLDIGAAEEARSAGLRYHRVEVPNTRAAFIRALVAIARRDVPAPV